MANSFQTLQLFFHRHLSSGWPISSCVATQHNLFIVIYIAAYNLCIILVMTFLLPILRLQWRNEMESSVTHTVFWIFTKNRGQFSPRCKKENIMECYRTCYQYRLATYMLRYAIFSLEWQKRVHTKPGFFEHWYFQHLVIISVLMLCAEYVQTYYFLSYHSGHHF